MYLVYIDVAYIRMYTKYDDSQSIDQSIVARHQLTFYAPSKHIYLYSSRL